MQFCMRNIKCDSEVIVGICCYLLMLILDRAWFCCGRTLMYKISLLVFLMGHTYIVVSQFLIKLLITYGDTGNKAALKDERVFGSVKCHVLYFFSFLYQTCQLLSNKRRTVIDIHCFYFTKMSAIEAC